MVDKLSLQLTKVRSKENVSNCLGDGTCEHYKDGSCDKTSCNTCSAKFDCIRDYNMNEAKVTIARGSVRNDLLLIRQFKDTLRFDSIEPIIVKLDVENYKGNIKTIKWDNIGDHFVMTYAHFRAAVTNKCCHQHQKICDYLRI